MPRGSGGFGHGTTSITIGGTSVVCLPHRALWIPEERTLVVADLHWGKAASFRAAQIPVPIGTTAADLQRLSNALAATAATHLVILGDLLHAASGWHASTEDTVLAWRARHADVAITLVRGNHDRHAGDPPSACAIRCVDGPHPIGPFLGVHEPPIAPTASEYMLSGHLHPCATVRGRGRQTLRLAAFIVGARRAILPAFSSFTGGGMYAYTTGDRVYAVAGDEVLEIPGRSDPSFS